MWGTYFYCGVCSAIFWKDLQRWNAESYLCPFPWIWTFFAARTHFFSSMPNWKRAEKKYQKEKKWSSSRNEWSYVCSIQKMCCYAVCSQTEYQNLEVKRYSDWLDIKLLSKSDDLSVVSEFRPIAITCVAGKIFFSVLSGWLQVFMLRNSQKGFLVGMSGCIEHIFALLEAIRDAKESHRQIVITWLDLANAYGIIRYNWIQFALNWYHIPKAIQEMIYDYYEKLCAMNGLFPLWYWVISGMCIVYNPFWLCVSTYFGLPKT